VTALVIGGLVLAFMAADAPLARLAHQSLDASGGFLPIWYSAAFAAIGFVVAFRRPRNPLGWVLLADGAIGVLSQDASFYVVADYRLHHSGLPFGWAALLAQPGWAPAIALAGLAMLLFPDGRPPSLRWRWLVLAYLATGLLWVASAVALTVGAIAGHSIHVDASGNLLLLGSSSSPRWWDVLSDVFFASLAGCWLASLTGQVVSYRRSRGERRQQLKWLATGVAVVAVGVVAKALLGSGPGAASLAGGILAAVSLFALPLGMGVAIFKYRLFDIDRLVSRTVGYAVITSLLLGVYYGLVLLATKVAGVTTPIAVAGSTLAAAALFSPVRRRVQRVVDRRFNRARYDADRTLAAFAERLQDAVGPDSASEELVAAVARSLEPTHISVWVARRLPGNFLSFRHSGPESGNQAQRGRPSSTGTAWPDAVTVRR
jgi:hypothetical protein